MGVSPRKRDEFFTLMANGLPGIILAGLVATTAIPLGTAVIAAVCIGLVMGYIWDRVLRGISMSLIGFGCMLLALSMVTRLFH